MPEIESTRCRVFNREIIIILFLQLYAQKPSCVNAIFVIRINLSRSIVSVHDIRTSQQMIRYGKGTESQINSWRAERKRREKTEERVLLTPDISSVATIIRQSRTKRSKEQEESEREKWRNVAWWEQFRRDEMQSRREKRQGTDQRDWKPEKGRKWGGGISRYFSV